MGAAAAGAAGAAAGAVALAVGVVALVAGVAPGAALAAAGEGAGASGAVAGVEGAAASEAAVGVVASEAGVEVVASVDVAGASWSASGCVLFCNTSGFSPTTQRVLLARDWSCYRLASYRPSHVIPQTQKLFSGREQDARTKQTKYPRASETKMYASVLLPAGSGHHLCARNSKSCSSSRKQPSLTMCRAQQKDDGPGAPATKPLFQLDGHRQSLNMADIM